jgi:hypothetical protein
VTPPTQAEVDAFFTSVDAFVKEAKPLVESGTPLTDEVRNPLRLKLIELTRTRGKLMRGMSMEKRRETAARLTQLMKLQESLLTPGIPSLTSPQTPPAPLPDNTPPPLLGTPAPPQ